MEGPPLHLEVLFRRPPPSCPGAAPRPCPQEKLPTLDWDVACQMSRIALNLNSILDEISALEAAHPPPGCLLFVFFKYLSGGRGYPLRVG